MIHLHFTTILKTKSKSYIITMIILLCTWNSSIIQFFSEYYLYSIFRAIPIRNVFLSDNALTTLSSSLLPWKKIQTVKLDGNPWHCDCKFSWIVSKDVYNLSAIDYSYLICKSPEHVADLPIEHLSKDNFGCSKSFLSFQSHIDSLFIMVEFK